MLIMYEYKNIITRQKWRGVTIVTVVTMILRVGGCKLTVTIVTTVTDRNIHRKSKIIVLKRKAGNENDSDVF